MNRRGFFTRLTQAIGSLTGLAFAAPVVAYLFPKPSQRGNNTLTTLDGEAIPAETVEKHGARVGIAFGEPTLVVFSRGEWKAFEAVCSHLGCIVRWQPQEEKIVCPCHGARFGTDGRVVSGPPPRPLKRYRVEIAQNNILLFEA
ncbi:MAG: Rieske 2Fe-2S domain-containing protein [Nitrospirae bacterium]|nr:Rieske 2Fe-2S domain-containing protein [Nitrospirota bacterium]